MLIHVYFALKRSKDEGMIALTVRTVAFTQRAVTHQRKFSVRKRVPFHPYNLH